MTCSALFGRGHFQTAYSSIGDFSKIDKVEYDRCPELVSLLIERLKCFMSWQNSPAYFRWWDIVSNFILV